MTEDEILRGIEATKDWYYYINEPYKYAEVEVQIDSRAHDSVSVFIKNNSTNQYVSIKDEKLTILGIRRTLINNKDLNNCIQERNKIIEISHKY